MTPASFCFAFEFSVLLLSMRMRVIELTWEDKRSLKAEVIVSTAIAFLLALLVLFITRVSGR